MKYSILAMLAVLVFVSIPEANADSFGLKVYPNGSVGLSLRIDDNDRYYRQPQPRRHIQQPPRRRVQCFTGCRGDYYGNSSSGRRSQRVVYRGMERVKSGSYRVKTGTERVKTGSYRVKTGTERIKTSTEVVSVGKLYCPSGVQPGDSRCKFVPQ